MTAVRVALASILGLAAVSPGIAAPSPAAPLRLVGEATTASRDDRRPELRVAVFAHEDGDATNVGRSVASLLARTLLTQSEVPALTVLFFDGDFAATRPEAPAYFDKVAAAMEWHKASIGVWGRVLDTPRGLELETFIQLSATARRRHFRWTLPLGTGVAGAELRAALQPDRFTLQRLAITGPGRRDIDEAARDIASLRAEPSARAGVAARLEDSDVFKVVDRRGDWMQVRRANDKQPAGWVPSRVDCAGDCARVLESARFAAGLLRYMARGEPPRATASLTVEALAVEEQIRALEGLGVGSADRSLELARRWVGPARWTGPDRRTQIDRGRGAPPGGAAFANVRAMAEIASASQHGRSEIPIDRDVVRRIAFDLAQAVQDDPRNREALHNLEVLFDYALDRTRANVAQSLSRTTYDEGLRFESLDGGFAMKVNGRVQVRLSRRDLESGPSKSFGRLQRVKARMEGRAHNHLYFGVQVDLAEGSTSNEGAELLEDAYAVWAPRNLAQLWVGQGRAFFGRQELTSSRDLQFVDRSLASDRFAPGRQVGAAVLGRTHRRTVEYAAGVYNGNGINAGGNDDDRLMTVGRIVFSPFGGTELRESALDYPPFPKLSVGASVAANEVRDVDVTRTDLYGLELGFRLRGISVVGEYFREERTVNAGPEEGNDGFYAQVGFLLPGRKLELAGRLSEIRLDQSSDPMEREIGVAVSYYFDEHRYKAQADFRKLDIDADPNRDGHELRVQLQIVF